MSAGAPAVRAFEVLRFEAVPAEAGVAVLVLAGRYAGSAPPGVPRLLVERGGHGREVAAVTVDALGDELRAAFAVPLDVLGAADATFALVPARGPIIGLPAPSPPAVGDAEGYVRLARAANDLRHRLADAERRRVEADDRAEAAETTATTLRARTEKAERAAAESDRRAAEAVRTSETEVQEAKDRAGRAIADSERLVAEARADAVAASEEAERVAGEAREEADALIVGMREELERGIAAARAHADKRVAAAERDAAAARDEADARATAAGNLVADAERAASATLGERDRAVAAARAQAEREFAEERSRLLDEARAAAEREFIEERNRLIDEARAAAERELEAQDGDEDDDAPARPAFDGTHAALLARLDDAEDLAERFRTEALEAVALAHDLEARVASAESEARAARHELADARRRAPGGGGGATSLFAAVDDDPPTAPTGPSAPAAPARRPEPSLPAPRAVPDPPDLVAPITVRRQLRPVGGPDDEEVLAPAQVGARMIRPAESHGRSRLLPRLAVLGVLLLLIAALALIVLGAGLV
jgi:hypothetical protein